MLMLEIGLVTLKNPEAKESCSWKILQNSHENTCVGVSFLIKLLAWGKHLYWSLSFNKVAGLRPATLFKKGLQHRCFPVNFVKFLGQPFLRNTSRRLLLKINLFYDQCPYHLEAGQFICKANQLRGFYWKY